MIEIIPFRQEHMDTFTPGDRERRARVLRDGGVANRFIGKAVSIIDNGVTLGIVGITVTDGAPLASVMLSDSLRARPMVLHRLVVRGLSRAVDYFGFTVLDATVKNSDAKGRKWLKKIGFRQYNRGEVFTRYRWAK